MQEVTEKDLEAAVSDTGGYEVPPEASLTVPITEYVRLETYSPEMQPYIEDLFIKKFPEVVSRHSLDLGDLSKTLGYYNLKLKKSMPSCQPLRKYIILMRRNCSNFRSFCNS